MNVVLPQIVYELPTTAQWSFDVAWCPRNPAVVCTSSFDGHVSLFSLMGGGASGQDFHQQKVSGLEFQPEQEQMMFIAYLYHSNILNNKWFYHMMLLRVHLLRTCTWLCKIFMNRKTRK